MEKEKEGAKEIEAESRGRLFFFLWSWPKTRSTLTQAERTEQIQEAKRRLKLCKDCLGNTID
jgi:hypothetical protein